MAVNLDQDFFFYEDLVALTEADLLRPEVLTKVWQSIQQDPTYGFEMGQANVLYHKFAAIDNAVCKKIAKYLYWQTLPTLLTEEFIQTLGQDCLAMTVAGVDPRERLDMFLKFNVSGWTAIERRNFFDRLLQALKNNPENISSATTVGEMLAAYDRFLNGKTGNSLSHLELINSGQIKGLNKTSQDQALMILDFYDQIKSVFRAPAVKTPPTLTNVGPQPQSVSPPPLPRPTAPVTPAKEYSQDEVYNIYQGSSAERTAIDARARQISATTGNDFGKLADGLYLLVSKPKIDQELEQLDVIATLRVLASHEKLDDLLKDDQRFFGLVHDDLVRTGQTALAQDFRLHPTAVPAIRYFLAMVFEGKMKLAENDAARFALQLGNLLKKAGNNKYLSLSYFDVNKGQFVWRK